MGVLSDWLDVMRVPPSYRFWLAWAAASSLAAGVGFAIGFIPAGIAVVVSFAAVGGPGLTSGGVIGWMLGVGAGAAVEGLAIGMLVGPPNQRCSPGPGRPRSECAGSGGASPAGRSVRCL